jgi:hydroxymethylglutaryl-CoA reductase
MHKSILKMAVNTAFMALTSAMNLIAGAYSFASGSGQNVLDLMNKQIKDLHDTMDKAVDDLP